jgi:rfaE bifunctional protein nucleotidyltransferase chain/domain
MNKNKIFSIHQIKQEVSNQKKNGKKILLCHGVFDLIHIGHLRHFKAAKSYGDFLIISLTTDKFVNKGFGRPFFKQNLRAEACAALEMVDAVVLSDSASSKKIINLIKPDFYIKGNEYKIHKKDITKKITEEVNEVKKNGGKIIYTDEETYSSSNLINLYGRIFNEEQSLFIKTIKKKYDAEKILQYINKFLGQKILVIGESIIDRYIYCDPLGKSGKEPYLAFKNLVKEEYIGGSLAVARQLGEFYSDIDIISYLGDQNNYLSFIKKNFSKKIKIHFFTKKNSPTILKTRYIDLVTNKKLFGCYSINDDFFSKKQSLNIYKKIKKISKDKNLILITDYGHGLIDSQLSKKICLIKKPKSLNAQINAANFGRHNLRNYKNIDNMIINETELRYEMRDKNTEIFILAKKLLNDLKIKNLIVTMGANGAILISNKGDKIQCPAFEKNVVDKIGAGDAMLTVISLALNVNVPKDLTLFFGSIIASMSIKIVANKKSINFTDFYRAVEFCLK